MNVGIVGIGLIGGSLAKAYKSAGHSVYGFDIDQSILSFAQVSGALDGVLCGGTSGGDSSGGDPSGENTIEQCDVIFLAVNPGAAVAYLEKNAPYINKNTVVIDCCGVKRFVCSKCFPLAKQYGFIFAGGHPMAGSHKDGFKNSREDLFHDASIILIPHVYDDPVLFGRFEEILKPAGFSHLTVTTAEKHDKMIAFSSQMAHVVSNAFIKSPVAREHKGFSAGSYKDLTRVAQLNADMWSELCIENSDYLIKELEGFICEVIRYKDALWEKDKEKLKKLLEEGSRLKKETDN